MRGIWLHDDPSEKSRNLTNFIGVLKCMINLNRLSVPYIASNEILRTVLLHCPNLRFLDVAGSSEVTDNEVGKM